MRSPFSFLKNRILKRPNGGGRHISLDSEPLPSGPEALATRKVTDHLRQIGRGLRTADLELPPSNDFAPVIKQLRAAMPVMQHLLTDKPGQAPNNRIEGGWWRMSQRHYVRQMARAIDRAEKLTTAIDQVSGQRHNDPDAEERAYDGVRDSLLKSRRAIRRGLEAAASYYHVLLDDSPTANSIGAINTKLSDAIGKVTNTGFNYAALKDWLDDGTLPGDQPQNGAPDADLVSTAAAQIASRPIARVTNPPAKKLTKTPANTERPLPQRRVGAG